MSLTDKFNALSEDTVTSSEIISCINSISQAELTRLCELVTTSIDKKFKLTNYDDFRKANAVISNIATQEGILPSALFAIYTWKIGSLPH